MWTLSQYHLYSVTLSVVTTAQVKFTESPSDNIAEDAFTFGASTSNRYREGFQSGDNPSYKKITDEVVAVSIYQVS